MGGRTSRRAGMEPVGSYPTPDRTPLQSGVRFATSGEFSAAFANEVFRRSALQIVPLARVRAGGSELYGTVLAARVVRLAGSPVRVERGASHVVEHRGVGPPPRAFQEVIFPSNPEV